MVNLPNIVPITALRQDAAAVFIGGILAYGAAFAWYGRLSRVHSSWRWALLLSPIMV